MSDSKLTDLKEIFRYEPETGTIFWKKNYRKSFIGKPAGNISTDKYRVITYQGKTYKAHRLAFYLVNGAWPSGPIDHINGVKDDNRWQNLREVTAQENQQNRKLNKNNKSGALGVSWINRDQKWLSAISIKGKKITLGLFVDYYEAVAARKEAEKKYGYHDNHGR